MFGKLVVVAAAATFVGASGVRPSEGAPRAHVHVVQPGETLWAIASETYDGSDPREAIWRIRRANDLGGAVVHPGQRLVLP